MPTGIPKSARGCKTYNEAEAHAAWLDYLSTRESHGIHSAKSRQSFVAFLRAYTRGVK